VVEVAADFFIEQKSNIIWSSLDSRQRIEVLVKAEHDFYREKWQKEKNRTRVTSHHM
jgi:hypothetical protein